MSKPSGTYSNLMTLLLFIFLFLGGSAWASTPLYQTVVTNDGASTYYRLDEASGDFNPIIGGGPTCGALGSITYSQTGALSDGSGDTAAKFDGSTAYCDGGVQTGAGLIPDSTLGAGWTLEAWFKPSAIQDGALVSMDTPPPDTVHYAWGLFTTAGGGIQFQAYGKGTGAGTLCEDGNHVSIDTIGTVQTVNQWTYIAVTTIGKGTYTCSGNSCVGLSDVRIYINGHLNNASATFDYVTPEASLCQNTGNNIKFLMARFDAGITDYRAAGTLDEVAMYRHGTPASALTADQILCHYNAGIGHPELGPAGTQCFGHRDWPFTALLEHPDYSTHRRMVSWRQESHW